MKRLLVTFSLVLFIGGCESEGVGFQDGDGAKRGPGRADVGTTTSDAQSAGHADAGTVVSDAQPAGHGDTGTVVSDTQPAGRPTTSNPCTTRTGCTETVSAGVGSSYNAFACGWVPSTDSCYATPWCEPSVASVGTNAAYNPCEGSTSSCFVTSQPTDMYGAPAPISQRPESASCGAGGTYTYKAGTLMVWGVSAQGSAYSTASIASDGYLCVPSTHDIVINC